MSLTFIALYLLLPQRSKQRLSKELSDYVVYCKSVHFSSFKHSRIHSKFYEVASFTESKARKHLREAGESDIKRTKLPVFNSQPNVEVPGNCILSKLQQGARPQVATKTNELASAKILVLPHSSVNNVFWDWLSSFKSLETITWLYFENLSPF